jgi:four helix bundle protein
MSEIRGQTRGAIRHFADLIVWQKSFALGLTIYEVSKSWPKEERYSLTDQVRRSSRSVGANIAEVGGKRRYEAHFVSKLTDADAELHETEHWLRYASAHGYLTETGLGDMKGGLDEVGRMLGSMMAKPSPFLLSREKAAADL